MPKRRKSPAEHRVRLEKKRTVLTGLRVGPRGPTPPPHLRDVVRPMRELLFDQILANNRTQGSFSLKEKFALAHIFLAVCYFLGRITIESLKEHMGKGIEAELFSQKEISALNFLVLEAKETGRLESLRQRLEGKTQGAKN